MRSESMVLGQLSFTRESTWELINFLGYQQNAMFVKQDKQYDHFLSNDLLIYADRTLKRCEVLLDFLKTIQQQMKNHHIKVPKLESTRKENLKKIDSYCASHGKTGQKLFEDAEMMLTGRFTTLNEHLQSLDRLRLEKKKLVTTLKCLLEVDSLAPNELNNQNLGSGFKSILGYIDTDNTFIARKILSRVTKDNVVIKAKNLEVSDGAGKIIQKTLLMILILSGENNYLENKIKLALSVLDFSVIDQRMVLDRDSVIAQQKNHIKEMTTVLMGTKREITDILDEFCSNKLIDDCSYYQSLKLIISREHNFAQQLLYVKMEEDIYHLEVWIPESQFEIMKTGVESIQSNELLFTKPILTKLSSLEDNSNKKPPTSFHNNSLIYPFQQMIDIYGIPRYKELNPAIFSIISFPFMFGLMFGDFGHGLCLFIGALFLYSSKLPILVKNRRFLLMIMLMGIFAMFCGLIYNEFFSIPLLIQDSCYFSSFKRESEECVYSFGIDWIWSISENETSFINSFKMKFSIVIGVIQMLLGIFLKICNTIHFKHYLDLFTEAIPQFLFMTLIFGYMVICILYKWTVDWSKRESVSIIQLFIEFTQVDKPLFENRVSQETAQKAFLAIASMSLVIMLLVKPFYSIIFKKKKEKSSIWKTEIDNVHVINGESHELLNSVSSVSSSDKLSNSFHKDEEESFAEKFIHQFIETIEFTLGSISNTASYLRLWALSLAHSQLSRVFLNMIFLSGISEGESVFGLIVSTIFGWVFFCIVTLGVILLMDSLECYLHALRLHWVEFQNKFFKGDGTNFDPFAH